MTALVLFLQIPLPGGLLHWLARFPAASIAGYLLQAAGAGLFLVVLGLAGGGFLEQQRNVVLIGGCDPAS